MAALSWGGGKREKKKKKEKQNKRHVPFLVPFVSRLFWFCMFLALGKLSVFHLNWTSPGVAGINLLFSLHCYILDY